MLYDGKSCLALLLLGKCVCIKKVHKPVKKHTSEIHKNILIWDNRLSHTHIWVYAYGMSHTRMGQNTHIRQNISYTTKEEQGNAVFTMPPVLKVL